MANANTVTNLDDVYHGIVTATKRQFPDLKTVEAHRIDRDSFPTPACLLEMNEWDRVDDGDPGTGQLAINARFEAIFALNFKQGIKNPKLEVIKLASAFALFAHLQRWGCPIGPADVIGAYPENFDHRLEQYHCWRVEWRQIIYLGDTAWKDEGVTPETIMLGFAPNIGAGHESDYVKVAELPVINA